MPLDRTSFFDALRRNLFAGRLSKGQVEGVEAILTAWRARMSEGSAATPPAACGEALAYVLATAFHETAATMQPVRETLAASDEIAIARLDAAFAAGRLASVKTPYWRPDRQGRSWFGRGLVQLTHRRNYEAMSAIIGIDLVADPVRAMRMDVAAAILIEGMLRGSFTGRKLDDYFGPGRTDWLGARRIINGTDRAELVARHAKIFAAALSRSL